MNELRSATERYCGMLGISLTEEQLSALEVYAELLCEKNKVMNLTAITEERQIALKHFADCLSIFSRCELPEGASVIDVGTGAGFPGIPWKIFRPDLTITLFDSLAKRVGFLQEVIDTLGLAGIKAVHGRAEEAARRGALREGYDIATARAVANLRDLSEYCLPFVKVGGKMLALKGPDADREAAQAENAVETLGGKILCIERIALPEDNTRTVVVIEKQRPTPPKYPRNAGQMMKKPL